MLDLITIKVYLLRFLLLSANFYICQVPAMLLSTNFTIVIGMVGMDIAGGNICCGEKAVEENVRQVESDRLA